MTANHRKLTPADAIEIGIQLHAFRSAFGRLPAKQLYAMSLGSLRQLAVHRRKWGADHRWWFELHRAKAREALRLARQNGLVLP